MNNHKLLHCDIVYGEQTHLCASPVTSRTVGTLATLRVHAPTLLQILSHKRHHIKVTLSKPFAMIASPSATLWNAKRLTPHQIVYFGHLWYWPRVLWSLERRCPSRLDRGVSCTVKLVTRLGLDARYTRDMDIFII